MYMNEHVHRYMGMSTYICLIESVNVYVDVYANGYVFVHVHVD